MDEEKRNMYLVCKIQKCIYALENNDKTLNLLVDSCYIRKAIGYNGQVVKKIVRYFNARINILTKNKYAYKK